MEATTRNVSRVVALSLVVDATVLCAYAHAQAVPAPSLGVRVDERQHHAPEVTQFSNDQLALLMPERDRLATLFSKTPEPARRSVVVQEVRARVVSMAGVTIPSLAD